MRGILRTHYKQVEAYLKKLQEENAANSYCPFYENIFQHKEKLQDIYKNYRETYEQMNMLTLQFEEHKQSVKRLVIMQKNKKREMLKRNKVNEKYSLVLSKI
jgi:hypothetical protein